MKTVYMQQSCVQFFHKFLPSTTQTYTYESRHFVTQSHTHSLELWGIYPEISKTTKSKKMTNVPCIQQKYQ